MQLAIRLSESAVRERAARLEFRPDDTEDAVRVAAAVLGSREGSRALAILVERLRPEIGRFDQEWPASPWDSAEARTGDFGPGVLPLLALLVTAEEVVAFQRGRGVPEAMAWRNVADFGEQVWVFRRTHGVFGLDTHEWMRLIWSGAFCWVGRLQFDLERYDADGAQHWVVGCHIPHATPASGPLTPASVDDAFARARRFWADYFGDYPVSDLHCTSWLLDPALLDRLPPQSNLVRFGRRFELTGRSYPGDADALYFTFFRRDRPDLATLPQDTTLQRVIVERLANGGHWQLRHGRIPGVMAP